MSGPHNPNNITMPPTSEDTVILGERGREIPQLKPCPFCGNDKKPRVIDWEGEGFPGYVIICDAAGFDGDPRLGCGASSGWGETPSEAAVAWNRRSHPLPPSNEVTE